MPTLDDIADRACAEAGADFAFVLSRRGRLVTQNAPKDMPESGRGAIAALAEELLAARRGFGHLEIPRQDLVPYGGAAPVDVYVAARPEAVLCVVMATYAPQNEVGGAISRAVIVLDALLEEAQEKRAKRRGKSRPPSKGSTLPPARSSTRPPRASSRSGRKTGAPPALDFDDVVQVRGTIPMLSPVGAIGMDTRRPTPPPLPPEITVSGEAQLGRSTLAAIEVDRDAPEITYGLAPIGRRTISEIELSEMPKGDPRSSVPTVRVELASMPKLDPGDIGPLDRQTLPFTESAEDLKRAFDAAQRQLGGASSTVATNQTRTVIVGHSKQRDPSLPSIVVETLNSGAAAAVEEANSTRATDVDQREITEESSPPEMIDGTHDPESVVTESGERPTRKNPRDSNIEDWHKALSQMVPPRPAQRVGRGATGFAAAAKKKPKG
ncbi:MAG: hypothetical protein HOV80_13865 [Polyangiaceae bacterium]|nr:hypothetical protein [Polyangiaceae bacterium]